jgi:uncharacterized repeat protein (TIGR01451 family)
MTSKLRLLSASSGFGLMLAFASPAYAQNTNADTLIRNDVTVNYQVGTVAQTPVTAFNEFRVDRKVLFLFFEKTATGTTDVTSGQQDQITAFTVANTSNDVLDFVLTATNTANGTTIGGGRGSDSIDVTNFEYYLDVNGNGLADDAGAWTTTLTLDNVAKGTGLATPTLVHVLVRSDIPLAANGAVGVVQLQAEARNSVGTTVITAVDDTNANTADITAGTFQTIWAEDLTPVQGNTARNGVSWAWDDYTVAAPNLAVAKTSTIISDGVSVTQPKAIPGAVVEYCISVVNSGGATASSVVLSDHIPANTTFVSGSIRLNASVASPGLSQTCTGGTAATDASDAPTDYGRFGSVTIGVTTANGVEATLNQATGIAAGGGTSALIFRATIN